MKMELHAYVQAVRSRRPLVHNITNLVVNNAVANVLLAIGASPVMAYAHEEVSDMARIAQALAANMGTVTPQVVEAIRIAGMSANEANVPVVFDPVGVGATPYRNAVVKDLLDALHVTVLRGNAGEISTILGLEAKVKGVDSVSSSAELPIAMKAYARLRQTVVIATGRDDYVTDGDVIWKLSNGDPMLAAITGSGCMLTGIIGAFVGVIDPALGLSAYAEACVAAITMYNVAAEQAARQAQGPGTFQMRLFDALYHIDAQTVQQSARVEVMKG